MTVMLYADMYNLFIGENFQNIRIFCQTNTDNRVETNNHLFLTNNSNINITYIKYGMLNIQN